MDRSIEKIERIIKNFYQDELTAFLVTSDHGMNDFGTHGDGSPENTRTPIFAWGSGIANSEQCHSGHDIYSADWELFDYARKDIRQIDICPLMATLIGVPIPVNSMGSCPIEYLDTQDSYKANVMKLNAKQIYNQYLKLDSQKRENEIWYVPFSEIDCSEFNFDSQFTDVMNPLESIRRSKELIEIFSRGIQYLHSYDWIYLRVMIVAGYIGWFAFSILFLRNQEFSQPLKCFVISACVTSGVSIVLYMKRSPIEFHIYTFFPILLLVYVLLNRKNFGIEVTSSSLLNILKFVGIVEVLVLSFHFRFVVSICCLVVSLHYLFYSDSMILTCLFTVLSVFPLLDPAKNENSLIMYSCLIKGCLGLLLESLS